jgi:hypothetical protein
MILIVSIYRTGLCYVFSVRCPVRDGATAQQLPLLFTNMIAREKQRKLVGSGAITDGETDAKNASVDGPLYRYYIQSSCSRRERESV